MDYPQFAAWTNRLASLCDPYPPDVHYRIFCSRVDRNRLRGLITEAGLTEHFTLYPTDGLAQGTFYFLMSDIIPSSTVQEVTSLTEALVVAMRADLPAQQANKVADAMEANKPYRVRFDPPEEHVEATHPDGEDKGPDQVKNWFDLDKVIQDIQRMKDDIQRLFQNNEL